MGDQTPQTPAELLAAYDGYLAGALLSENQMEMARQIAMAGCFAARAMEFAGDADQGTHAMTRTFLLALTDHLHPDLDYLRDDPRAGEAAREANAILARLAARKGDPP